VIELISHKKRMSLLNINNDDVNSVITESFNRIRWESSRMLYCNVCE